MGGRLRPGSFLREETDEFDRLFHELSEMSAQRCSKTEEMKRQAEQLWRDMKDDSDSVTGDTTKVDSDHDISGLKKGFGSPSHTVRITRTMSTGPGGEEKTTEIVRESNHVNGGGQKMNSGACNGGKTPGFSNSLFSGSSSLRRSKLFGSDDKLFLDLLDDLDNIAGNTHSARRRRKARDLFADWLFMRDDRKGVSNGEQRKSKESFTDFATTKTTTGTGPSESLDVDDKPAPQNDIYSQWQEGSKSYEYPSEVGFLY